MNALYGAIYVFGNRELIVTWVPKWIKYSGLTCICVQILFKDNFNAA